MNRGAWWVIVHEIRKSDTTEYAGMYTTETQSHIHIKVTSTKHTVGTQF